MQEAGVTNFIEIGPGKVLSGFVKIDKTAKLANVEDQASLEALLGKLVIPSPHKYRRETGEKNATKNKKYLYYRFESGIGLPLPTSLLRQEPILF